MKCKLGEETSLITKGTTPKNKLVNGDVNFVKVEDIIGGKIYPRTKISSYENDNYLKRSKLKENDILFSIAGTLGRTASVDKSILPANTNQALAIIRGYSFDKNYLMTVLNSYAVAKYIQENPTVGAQPNLSLRQVGKMIFEVPSITEQIMIGNFFRNIDNLITVNERELNKLRNLKKSYLEKMFPKNGSDIPELRFPCYTDAWVKCELGDVVDIVGGGTPSTSVIEYWNGEINWYSPVEIGNQIYVSNSQNKITKLGLEKSSAKILPAYKTILFTSRAGIGNTAIITSDGATNQGFQSLVIKEKMDLYFLYTTSYKIKEMALQIASGSTFLEISGKSLSKLEILLPNFEEQTKIGKFFKQLDNLITVNEHKLFNSILSS